MHKLYFCLFFFLLLPSLLCQGKKKEYLLVWNDIQGFESISLQNNLIINERFEIQDGKPKLIKTRKVQYQYTVYHTIVSSEKDEMIVRILHKDAKILLDAERKLSLSLDTPQKIKEAMKYPDLEPFIPIITGGFVYKVNKTTGEVLGTWELREEEQKIDQKTKKEDVKYAMTLLGKEPKGLSTAFHLIPNKAVPVGYEWNRRQMGEQTEDMKLASVVSHMKRKSVAKITRKGNLIQNETKVGTIEGILFFDLEYKSTLEHVTRTIREQYRTIEDNKKKRNILEKTTNESRIALLHNNYDLIQKKKP